MIRSYCTLSRFYRFLLLLLFILAVGGCGNDETLNQLERINERLRFLSETASSLVAVIHSDYSTCPNTGDTADALIRKICIVAQAANNEARVAMKGELAVYVQHLQGQLNAVNENLARNTASVESVELNLALIQSQMDNLTLRMTNAESAISALQSLTASIMGILAGNVIEISIGSENPVAGPLYESCLRRQDRKNFSLFVEAYGPLLSLPNNPLVASSGSSLVTVTMTAHALSAGDSVHIEDLTEGKGFTSGDLWGDFVVQTVPNTNSFTIKLRRNAVGSGALGGSLGIARKVNGRGMSTVWRSGDPSDTTVRLANLGSKRYYFLIRRKVSDASNSTAELCYDKTNHLATFATINTAGEGGSGNIVCK